MLVLTRDTDQDILIGVGSVQFGEYVIRICVVGFSRGKVKIGIEAPEDLVILRSELVKETAK